MPLGKSPVWRGISSVVWGAGIAVRGAFFVMAGLDPAIHVFGSIPKKDVDARVIGERKRRRPSDGYARA
jgi:hypothetical protein